MRKVMGMVGGGLAALLLAAAVMGPGPAVAQVQGVPFDVLQAQVDELKRELAAERQAREAAVAALGDRLTTDVAGLRDLLDAEVAARQAGDASLTTALARESAARAQADADLTSRLRALEGQSLITTVQTRTVSIPAITSRPETVYCPWGRVVGGGWLPDSGEGGDLRAMLGSGPFGQAAWKANLANNGFSAWDGTVYAVCARVG